MQNRPRWRRWRTRRASRGDVSIDRRCGRCPLQPGLCCFSCWIVWWDEAEGSRLYQTGLISSLPNASKRCLGLREPLAKALARDTQRVLRVDLQTARQRDDGEQQVTHLIECLPGIGGLRELPSLLGDVLCRLCRRFEIESDASRPLLQP